jgi:ribose transport system substrate-binding protein
MHNRIFKILTVLFLIALCSCGKTDNSTGNGKEIPTTDKAITIALIMKSLANEFFVTMADGAKAHQEKHREQYQLIINGTKNESDLAQQVALIDQMIAARVDAIVIAPADSKAIVPALDRAIRSGIKVLNIDNKLDTEVLAEYSLQIPFVGPDNRAGARMVGDFLSKQLPDSAQVAILEGIPTAYNSQQRRAGFEDAAHHAGLDIVTTQSAGWDQIRAAEITTALLVQFPELKAIMCANDSMALGAVSAIRQAGKGKDIQVVGFDNISAIQALLKEGGVLATADQHADQLAVFGIEYVLDVINSDNELSDRQTDVDLITRDSF